MVKDLVTEKIGIEVSRQADGQRLAVGKVDVEKCLAGMECRQIGQWEHSDRRHEREVEGRTARRVARNKYVKRKTKRGSCKASLAAPQSLPSCEASTLNPDGTVNVSDSSGRIFVMAQVEAFYSRNSATKHTGVTIRSACWYESSLSAPKGVTDGLGNLGGLLLRAQESCTEDAQQVILDSDTKSCGYYNACEHIFSFALRAGPVSLTPFKLSADNNWVINLVDSATIDVRVSTEAKFSRV